MFLLPAYDLRRAVVIYVACAEDGLGIVRTVRGQFLQVVMEFLGHIFEIDDGIDIEGGFRLFGEDMLIDILLEAPAEFGDVLYLQ